ncbi:MAG: YkgJ family cysteine cluster protein [Oscillospiraceae bacterium]
MLRKLLKPEQCAKCRICCGFVDDDRWEIPLIAGEDEQRAAERLGSLEPVPGTKSCVYHMEFHGNEIISCPALGENGCRLGQERPFDCRIWPFRVNDLNGTRVITLSPVCPEVIKLPVSVISEFVNSDGFADMLFRHAELFPEAVKPYIAGYPILAAENLST